jgi:hypothetical protein
MPREGFARFKIIFRLECVYYHIDMVGVTFSLIK